MFTVEGSEGQGIQLTSVAGGSILSTGGTPYDMSTIAPRHKFVFVPPPSRMQKASRRQGFKAERKLVPSFFFEP